MVDDQNLWLVYKAVEEAMKLIQERWEKFYLPFILTAYETVYEAYIKSGAEFGETHDGFMKWLEKLKLEAQDE